MDPIFSALQPTALIRVIITRLVLVEEFQKIRGFDVPPQ
jgi:hypothetical protein